MKKDLKFYLFFLGLICYGMFFTDRLRFEVHYSTYYDTFVLYFLNIFRDPGLFVKDAGGILFRQYMDNPTLREFGVLSVYRLLLNFMSVGIALKLVSVLLSFFSAFFVYRTGQEFYKDDKKAFFLTTAFLVCFLSMDSFYYGQNRTFGAFFFVFLVYALYTGRYLAVPPLIYLFYLFYPYLALPAGLVSGWVFFRLESGGRAKYLLLLLGSIGLAAMTDIRLAAGLNQAAAFQPKFAAFSGGATLPGNPLHGLLYFFANLNEHSKLYVGVVALFLLAPAAAFFRRGTGVFSALREKAFAPLSMFFLSFAALYPLSPLFASREVVFAFPFALTLLFADNIFFLLRDKRLPAAAFLLALLFAAGHPWLNDIYDFSRYGGVYDRISGMPKDSVLAGAPDSALAAGVPFYAQRSLVYSDHTPGILSMISPGLDQAALRRSLAEAMCSWDPAAAPAFAREKSVDYFLVESRSYAPDGICRNGKAALYEAAVSGNNVFQASAEGDEVFLVDARKLAGPAKKRK